MLHTYELLQRVTYREERLLDKKLTAFFSAKRKYDSERRVYFYGSYSKLPIKLGIRTVHGKGGTFNYLVVIVNPMKVMKDEYVHISTMENAHLAHEEVRRIFKKIGIDDYFDRLSLSRIDYAFDIFLEDQSMVETYIQLMKRGNMPNGLLLKLFWHDTQHRSIPYRDSLYLKNNAVTINSYNKYEELKNKAKHFVDCERAIGILRLEVQCNGRKVEELEKKYGIDRYNPTDFFDEEIAREIVMSYVAKVTKLGAYHSLDNARCIINESRFNDRQKTELINFIEEVNSSRSLDKVKRSESYTPYQFRTRLKRLDELNINPVTIPFRWGYDYLSNLLTYIEQ